MLTFSQSSFSNPCGSSGRAFNKHHLLQHSLRSLYLFLVLSNLFVTSSPVENAKLWENLMLKERLEKDGAEIETGRHLSTCENIINTVEGLEIKLDECEDYHPYDSAYYGRIQSKADRLVKKINKTGGKCKPSVERLYKEICDMLNPGCPCPLHTSAGPVDTRNENWPSCCLSMIDRMNALHTCCL